MTAKTDWYWLDGSAYCPACVEGDSPAIDSAEATRGPCEGGRCACCGAVMEREYSIAFVLEGTGGFEVAETFTAAGDNAANAHAEEKYPGRPWYVLNANGENING